jgi:hypothetical protein
MRSRLDIASLRTVEAPMAHCTFNAMYTTQASGGSASIPLKGTAAQSLGMRFITGGPLLLGEKSVGKITSFALGREPVYIEMSMSKSGGGYDPIRKNLYLLASVEAEDGIIDMRVGNGSVTLLRGPVRLLTTAEAKRHFGNYFKETMAFNPAIDGARLGVGLKGHMSGAPVKATRTLDDAGIEHMVTVRRRHRVIEL